MIDIFPARDGALTARKDGLYLLSAYKPAAECARVLPEDPGGKFFVLFGGALGHLPAAMTGRGIEPDRFFVVEPDADLLDNLPPEYRSRACSWDQPSPLRPALESALIRRLKPEVIGLPSYFKAFPAEYAAFESSYRAALASSVENIKVDSYFSRVWMLNYVRNLMQYERGGRYALRNASRRPEPVVVAASGPSLSACLDELKIYRSRYVLVAALSAVRTLAAAGIVPDYAVVSDAGVANKLHAAGLDPKVPVAASVYANSALLASLPNPVVFYDAEAEIEHPRFRLESPSVTIDAGRFASDNFPGGTLFCGFDLAYSCAGSHSAANAVYELRRCRTTRLATFHSLVTSFMKRDDLKAAGKGWTHPQFEMTRDAAVRVMGSAFRLPGGLDFPGWPVCRSVGEFLDLVHAPAALHFEPVRTAPLADYSGPIRASVKAVRDGIRSDPDFASRVFVRQALSGDTGTIREKTLSKLAIISG